MNMTRILSALSVAAVFAFPVTASAQWASSPPSLLSTLRRPSATEAGARAWPLRLGVGVVVGAVVARVGRMPVGAAVAVAVVVAAGPLVGMLVGVEVSASGRRGVGVADASLTERARLAEIGDEDC
jgi:class 3 adenylate cyclase